jgi:protocatechuate 3,4-dioxygenase beta subunit
MIRRRFLTLSLGVPLALASRRAAAQAPRRPPTPACADPAHPTPPQTAGPYYKPDSPRRASLLEPGMAGTPLVVEGLVLTTACAPVARALVDVWQADDGGRYDNAGFRLRGHLFTDEGGRYRLETVVPGLYPGRTRHIHVRVQAPGRIPLTTQLYFPGEAANDRDFLFDRALLVPLEDAGRGKRGAFDFVLSAVGSRDRG